MSTNDLVLYEGSTKKDIYVQHMYRVYAAHLLQTVWGKEVTGGLFSIEEDVTIFTGLTKVTSQKRVALWPYKYILFNTLFHHFWNNWYDQDWHVLEISNRLSWAVLNRMQRKIDSIYKKETTIFQQGFLKRNKGEERQFHLMFFSSWNCFIKKWPLPLLLGGGLRHTFWGPGGLYCSLVV